MVSARGRGLIEGGVALPAQKYSVSLPCPLYRVIHRWRQGSGLCLNPDP